MSYMTIIRNKSVAGVLETGTRRLLDLATGEPDTKKIDIFCYIPDTDDDRDSGDVSFTVVIPMSEATVKNGYFLTIDNEKYQLRAVRKKHISNNWFYHCEAHDYNGTD